MDSARTIRQIEHGARAEKAVRDRVRRQLAEAHAQALEVVLRGLPRERREALRRARARVRTAQAGAVAALLLALETASAEAARVGAHALEEYRALPQGVPAMAAAVAAHAATQHPRLLGGWVAYVGRVSDAVFAGPTDTAEYEAPPEDEPDEENDSEFDPGRDEDLTPEELAAAALGATFLGTGEAWLDRISVTEAAYGFNAARNAVLRQWGLTERAMMKRWTEKIDDRGRPLDNRVAMDSVVLHAQVARPDGEFTMPEDNRVDAKWWGRSWAFPPNRARDRSCVTPWQVGDRQPAWLYDGTKKVWLSGSE